MEEPTESETVVPPVTNEIPHDETDQEKVLRLLGEGRKVKDIVSETGLSPSKVYAWRKQGFTEPTGFAPPNVSSPRGPNRGKAKPITDETGKQLLSGIFAIIAMIDGEEWFLTQTEGKALGDAFADTLRVVPNPVADAINTYSAPAIFATTLGAVVQHKFNLRKQRGRRPVIVPVPPRNPNVSNANVPPAPPPRTTPVQEQAPTGNASHQHYGIPGLGDNQPPQQSAGNKETDIANIFADARGTLQDEDEDMTIAFL